VLRPGQILNQEITGAVLGYGTQVNHAVCIGSPAPAEWVPAAQYCLEVLHNLMDWITPGKSAKEFNEFYNQKMQAKGITDTEISVIIHDSGLGYGPRIGPGRKEGLDLVFEPGWVFSMKPRAPMPQAHADVRIGDGMAVTDKGVRRLGKRKLEVISLGA
jgi:Xaa-Pro aminopeptidase